MLQYAIRNFVDFSLLFGVWFDKFMQTYTIFRLWFQKLNWRNSFSTVTVLQYQRCISIENSNQMNYIYSRVQRYSMNCQTLDD